MNLITGFFGVPWLLFFHETIWAMFFFSCFGFCFFIKRKHKVGWLFGLGDRAVEVVTNYFLFLFFWGPLVFSVCMGSAIASLTPAVEAL